MTAVSVGTGVALITVTTAVGCDRGAFRQAGARISRRRAGKRRANGFGIDMDDSLIFG
jgi:hypothetical protein